MRNFTSFSIAVLFLPFLALAANVDCDSPNIDLSREPKCKPGELTIVQELVSNDQLRCMGLLRKLVSCPGSSKQTKLIPKESFNAFIGSQFDDPNVVRALRQTNVLKNKDKIKDLLETLNGMNVAGVGIDDNGKVAELKQLQYLRDRYSVWLNSNKSATELTKNEMLSQVITENQNTISVLKSKSCKDPQYDKVLKSGKALVIRFDDGFEQIILPYDFKYQSGSKFEVSFSNGILGHGGMFAQGTTPHLETKKAVVYSDANGQIFYKSGEKSAYKLSGMRTLSLKEASKDSDGHYVDSCKIQALLNANIPEFKTVNANESNRRGAQ